MKAQVARLIMFGVTALILTTALSAHAAKYKCTPKEKDHDLGDFVRLETVLEQGENSNKLVTKADGKIVDEFDCELKNSSKGASLLIQLECEDKSKNFADVQFDSSAKTLAMSSKSFPKDSSGKNKIQSSCEEIK